MMKIIVLILSGITMNFCVIAQNSKEINLYKTIPGAKKSENYKEKTETVVNVNPVLWVTKVSVPTITYYEANNELRNGTAVIICPGGGYGGLAISHEGYDVAKKFADLGIAAFVLKYRLPSDDIMIDKKIGPLQDVQQAIKHVRENAKNYNINSDKIGIMGFSAGGHLASTASTHFNRELIENKNQTSLRPDFSILMYPVITFGDSTHLGSRNNLIGINPSKDLIDLYSNEKQITTQTPITFIVHSNDDDVVSVENVFLYIKALNQFSIKNEAHIYASGGHGYGIDSLRVKDVWFDRLTNWMGNNNLLNKTKF